MGGWPKWKSDNVYGNVYGNNNNINSPYGSTYNNPWNSNSPYNPVSHWNPTYSPSYPSYGNNYPPYNPPYTNNYPPYWPVQYNPPPIQTISYPQAVPYPQPIAYPQYIPVPYLSDPYMIDDDSDPGHCCNTVVSHHCHSGEGRRGPRGRGVWMSDPWNPGYGDFGGGLGIPLQIGWKR